MSFAIHHNALSRFSVALMGAALITGGLFYGIQMLIKPAELRLNYFTIQTTVPSKALERRSSSIPKDVAGFILPKATSDIIWCDCVFPGFPELEMTEWAQHLSGALETQQSVYHVPMQMSGDTETVYRATALLRDMPSFSGLHEEQRIHVAFSVLQTGKVDPASIRVLAATDPRLQDEAVAAISRWTYQPALEHGTAATQDNMEVVFIIEPAAN